MKQSRHVLSYQVIIPNGVRATTLQGFLNWYRVLRAMILRELKTRFAAGYLGYAWLFMEPMLHVIALTIIFSARGRQVAGDMELPVFILTGIVPFLTFTKIMRSVMSAVSANKGLMNYRRVRPMDAMFARVTLEYFLFYLTFFTLIGIAAWMGFTIHFNAPAYLLYVPVCICLMAFGLGAMFSIPVHLFPDFNHVASFLSRFLYFSSGIFFTVDRMPEEIRPYLMWNPLLHAVELIREGFFGGNHVSHGDPYYLGLCAVLIFSFGLSAAFTFRRRYYF
ncbi:MAG: ABC transporter permease [Alphaproteobacteria bacterium]